MEKWKRMEKQASDPSLREKTGKNKTKQKINPQKRHKSKEEKKPPV